jgi:hypothetical protein
MPQNAFCATHMITNPETDGSVRNVLVQVVLDEDGSGVAFTEEEWLLDAP